MTSVKHHVIQILLNCGACIVELEIIPDAIFQNVFI
jgi:hypothetical protein